MALVPDVVAFVVAVAGVSAATNGAAVTAETVGAAVVDDDATWAVEADAAAAATVVTAAAAVGTLGLQQLLGSAATNSPPDDPLPATVPPVADLRAATTASPPRPKLGRMTADCWGFSACLVATLAE